MRSLVIATMLTAWNAGEASVEAPVNALRPTGEVAKFNLSGGGFSIASLKSGERSFSNRKYTWVNVPKHLEGCRFAQTAGGIPATVRLDIKSSGVIHAAVMANHMLDLKEAGWEIPMPSRENTFWFSAHNEPLMIVMCREVKIGESYVVPQFGFAGIRWRVDNALSNSVEFAKLHV